MKWLKLLPLLWRLTGCATALPALSGLLPTASGSQRVTSTTVHLSRNTFKIVKANALGHSVGFSLPGLFSLKSPSTQLYRSIERPNGKAQTLVNVMHEQTSTYFVLFALPRITVRADVIEFIDAAPISSREGQVSRSDLVVPNFSWNNVKKCPGWWT